MQLLSLRQTLLGYMLYLPLHLHRIEKMLLLLMQCCWALNSNCKMMAIRDIS